MRLKSVPTSRFRRTQSLAILLALAACHPLVKKTNENKKARSVGVLSLSEAIAPAGVTQVQVVLLDEAKCKVPTPNAEPADIDITTGTGSGTTGANTIALTDGQKTKRKDYRGRQSGGWYATGMFGHSGTLDAVLAKIFNLVATTNIGPITVTNNITNNYYNTPAPSPAPAPEPAPAPAPEPAPAPAPEPAPAPAPEPAPAPDPTGSTVNGGYVPADPSCVVMNVQQPYVQSETLNFHGVPAGTYTILVLWEDENGVPLQQGSSTVTISADKVSVANIVMQPVTSTNGGLSVNVVKGATKLAFLDALPMAAPGVCTAVRVETQEGDKGPAPLASTISLSFASSAATGSFYTDSGCAGTPVVAVSLIKGATDVTVYYKDTAAGGPTLTVSSPDANLTMASSVMGAAAGQTSSTPAKIAWATAILNAKVNECSSLLALILDANDQQASFSALRLLNVSSSSATGTFYADASCTTSMTAFNLAIGATQASLFYKDATAGTATLTIADPASGGLGSSLKSVTISN
ncbi:MAG: hypothetical protein FJ146_02480 [Deltaproteobacteria bacterium]|nr:hypothetical protein [Deltaproteobacteria bacterium]